MLITSNGLTSATHLLTPGGTHLHSRFMALAQWSILQPVWERHLPKREHESSASVPAAVCMTCMYLLDQAETRIPILCACLQQLHGGFAEHPRSAPCGHDQWSCPLNVAHLLRQPAVGLPCYKRLLQQSLCAPESLQMLLINSSSMQRRCLPMNGADCAGLLPLKLACLQASSTCSRQTIPSTESGQRKPAAVPCWPLLDPDDSAYLLLAACSARQLQVL